jgi:3-deoxy-D-manno-octulosonate 8-phosphate phosphatase (KDO 8-P phosphatase)
MAARKRAIEAELVERLKAVRLLVFDIDGTLTDGTVTVGADGEALRFCVIDGYALKQAQRLGLSIAWISGRGSPAAEKRGRELGLTEIHLRVADKAAELSALQRRLGLEMHQTAAMGDDVPDLGLRARAGFFAAPSNARPEILACADWIAPARGGEGAVRELIELVLRAQDRWREIVAKPGG